VSAEVEAKDLQRAPASAKVKAHGLFLVLASRSAILFRCLSHLTKATKATSQRAMKMIFISVLPSFWLNEWQTSIGASTTASRQSVTEEDPQLGTPIKPLAPKNSMSQFRKMSEVKHRKSATPRARSISGPDPFVAYQADRNLLGKHRVLWSEDSPPG